MFKNSKLLKGVTVALAFVLLLCGGILLKQAVDAAGNTVVYYVSDFGDNTTGLDPTTAFNTFSAASAAANAAKLEPGTEVLFYLVEEVTLTTQSIDGSTIKDKNGTPLHLTIASYVEGEFATIDMAYVIAGQGTSGSQRATLANDVTFKDISIASRVQDKYVGDSTSNGLWRIRNFYPEGHDVVFDHCEFTSNQGKSVGTWTCYVVGSASKTTEGEHGVVFKNGDYSNVSVYTQTQAVPFWDLYFRGENASFGTVYISADSSTNQGDNAKSITIELKDCTAASFNLATTGHVSVPEGIEVTFDHTTVNGWAAGNSTSTLPTVIADITYNFIGDSVLAGATLAPRGVYSGNIVSNIDGCRFTGTYVGGGDAYTSVINGNITTNAKNCYFDFYCGGSRAAKIYGDVTNNLGDGAVCGGEYLGGNNEQKYKNDDKSPSAHVLGTIYNNFSGTCEFRNRVTCAGRRGNYNNVVNNISGGEFKHYFFGGGGYYNSSNGTVTRYCITGGNIVNNISGGHFGVMKADSSGVVSYDRGVYLGNRLGSCKSITNNITGGTFSCETFLGSYNNEAVAANVIDCGPIVNNISGDPVFKFYAIADIKAAGFTPKISSGKETDFTRIFMGGNYLGPCESITNNITGGTWYNGDVYLGGGRTEGGLNRNIVSGNIVNNISENAHFMAALFSGPRSQIVEGALINNCFGGAIDSSFIAGGYTIITPAIYNNFYNAEDGSHSVFSGSVYMASRGLAFNNHGYERSEIGSIYNNISGDVEFKGTFRSADGSFSTTTSVTYTVAEYEERGLTYPITATKDGKHTVSRSGDFVLIKDQVVSNISGGVFSKEYSSTYYNHHTAHIINNFNGGTFKVTSYGGGTSGGSAPFITNNFNGATFSNMFIGVGKYTNAGGTVINNVKDCYFGGHFYASSNTDGSSYCPDWTIVNNVEGGTFNKTFFGGSYYAFVDSVTNNISGGTFKGSESLSEIGYTSFVGNCYFKGYAQSVTNNISGGIFEKNVFLGGRNGADYTAAANASKKTCVLKSTVSGGIFMGGRFSGSIYNNVAANSMKTVILDIKPDESSYPLYFGCIPAGSNGAWGLDNFTSRSDVVTLHGASKPILIGSNTRLAFDAITGPVTIMQTESWVDGTVYVALPPSATGIENVRFANASDAVTGSAKTATGVAVNYQSASATVNCSVLVGSASETAPIVAPAIDAINFVLDSNLMVNFYADKATVEAYLAKTGSVSFSVSFGGKTLTSTSLTDLSTATIVGDKVKFACGFGIPAFRYGETLTVALAGNTTEATVYDLLAAGISDPNADASLVDLLKAIHNYGVKAEEKKFGFASVTNSYADITSTGTYAPTISSESLAEGYAFTSTGLAIDEDVLIYFYLKAEDPSAVTFTATAPEGTLPADRVQVIPFEGNSNYNIVVTLRLPINDMDKVFTLTASVDGSAVATCTNSVVGACAYYVENAPEYAPLAKALLAYVERV